MIKPTPVIYFSPVLVCGVMGKKFSWDGLQSAIVIWRRESARSNPMMKVTIERFQTDATGNKNFIYIMKKRTNETEYNYCKRENQVAM